MAKRLFFVSAAILMLMIAYHLGARNAQAQSGSYFRVTGQGVVVVGDHAYILEGSDTPPPWIWKPLDSAVLLPVPVSSCVYLTRGGAITAAGEGFIWDGVRWQPGGFVPGGTINVQPETWGGVKQKYR